MFGRKRWITGLQAHIGGDSTSPEKMPREILRIKDARKDAKK